VAQRLPISALLSANAVSMTGNALADVAIPWFVLQTTGSAAKMGLVLGVASAAKVAAAALTGPVADRLGLKRTSVATDLANVVVVALVPTLYWTVGLPFWALLVLVVLGPVVDMPGFSARLGLLPALADAARMPKERANSGYQAVQGFSGVAGPPLAGALVAAFGAPLVLLLNSITFAVSAALVTAAVPPRGPAPQTEATVTSAGSRRASPPYGATVPSSRPLLRWRP
jgi:MFS family permease